MYENETYEVILDRMIARVSDALDKRPSSPIYDTLSPTAIELQILYIELETLIQNSYGDTASREFLILLAKDRGLSPYPATHAVLKGVFTPTTIDVIGQRFNIGDINYTVIEQTGPGQYKVQCESTGGIGNQYLGQMVPMEYLPGLETAILTEVLIPGEDEEDTEIFRQRYFDSFNGQAFGGNQIDYMTKIRSIEGVGDCKVIRVWNGDIRPAEMIPNATVQTWYESVKNTLTEDVKEWLDIVYAAASQKKLTVGGIVKVIIVDSDDYGVASSTLVQNVQCILDPETDAGEGFGLAPIGHVVSVVSADAVQIQIKTTVIFEEGYSWSNTKTAMEETVNTYLLELRKAWAGTSRITVRISQVESRILAIKGIIDVTGTKINGSDANLTIGKYEIPVLGGVYS